MSRKKPPRPPHRRGLTQSRYLIGERTRAELGPAGVDLISSCLWPADCQTCVRPLEHGGRPALCMDLMGDRAIFTLHHRDCRDPGRDTGSLVVQTQNAATWAAAALLLPLTEGETRPMLLVNPGLEMVTASRESGTWQIVLAAGYAAAGMRPPGRTLHLDRPIAASAALTRDSIAVTFTDPFLDDYDAPVDIPLPDEIRRHRGVLLGVTNTLHPAAVKNNIDLKPALGTGRITLGWVPLR